ncbi:DUF4168 domain-containing protein [Gilvimarinus sp. SDUM040013]|uniref:DUF4168 domain-containing protein n=1 Tax=Gilvimarinus gilvus TaxID=3058038 RepID=A0ABU4S1V0_9GAMM|nr:DUF4168 domain-containing protein [Gilvimarinus sp. SDUM040013]MDO3385455.1 DUF4168 domain-containing protein [Gilvimarinus sp. SDUM040013]MDX6851128.1 DUF4168 domain-containing protein [Gilvimarinus sp. SDUM040013]
MKPAMQSLCGALVAATLASGAVHAEKATTQSPDTSALPSASASAMKVSEGQVAEFADAYVAVQSLSRQYGSQLQQITDPEKKQSIQQQAQSQMQTAIKDSGLSLSEYKNIANAANQSEALRQRITVAVNNIIQPEKTEESGS